MMRGEDFTYVIVRSSLHLYSFRLLSIFETLACFLKAKFAIDVCAADLSVELPRRVPVSVSYSLLDILFICMVLNDDNSFPFVFNDDSKILSLTLVSVLQIDRLGYQGECSLSY